MLTKVVSIANLVVAKYCEIAQVRAWEIVSIANERH
jgi:hypothetical protein